MKNHGEGDLMNILDVDFAQNFVRSAAMSFAQGWHERNGGNLSYRLTSSDIQAARACSDFLTPDDTQTSTWQNIDIPVPGLTGEYFMVTAAGSYFQNIERDTATCAGIIELDGSGTRWRKRWGFANGGRPTSELPTHLMNHEVRKRATNGASRVLHHAHPANIIALTFVLPHDSNTFTRELWGAISECAIVFPQGVGVIEWGVPGSLELACQSAAIFKTREAVIWPYHGIFCSGNSFDEAFGLLHTIEKAAEILVKVYSMGGPARLSNGSISRIQDTGIREMAEVYNLPINTDCLS
jgi:rhamnulose-1-phosphate aldolase